MSGIVGIVNGDGQPIDTNLLQQMTDLMRPQAPDARDIWSEGYVGFGHALLRTTWESENEQQPLGLNGKIWITGDIRLDRRQELIERLRASGCNLENNAPDVDLVLHAYQVWGDACLERLSGDFAFAIWDSHEQRLFCARDQFGIVPFYYAQMGQTLVFSNHLNTVRFHPGVSDRLNESAIADFLLFGNNMDRATTTFADIQKLPPAHTLIYSEGRINIQRYWQLPEDVEYLNYQHPEEYVEQFRELFEHSVADRLRTHIAGSNLSGGMDSTSIAATAYRLMKANHSSVDFRAYTIIYKQLIPDDEGDYAAQVAEMAGFPIEYLVAEDYIGQAPPEHPDYIYPEPLLIPTQVAEVDLTRRVAAYSRVRLAGFGGDPAFEPVPSSQDKLRQDRNNILGYIDSLRARVRLRTRLHQWLKREPQEQQTIDFPDWFNPDFAERMQLKARQEEIYETYRVSPQRDRYGMATAPLWSNIFSWSDPGFTGFPLKARFPFFDLRLVSYLLSVPPTPWFENKFLLREAMKGLLPESVRQRPKTTLQGFPHYTFMQQHGLQPWMVELMTAPELTNYVNSELLLQKLQSIGQLTPASYNQAGLVLHLAYWLRHQ
ncbi:asparagine synthase-related protein [Roseofilum reptotaenium CS-1145]|uniref:asparagine synthase (glutamine-hydrolyzing) n=1 Tax=Roseofilum reptotaenium AO1-A TaxID=1925591 RepID=A0A1L9QWE5_9CYAN|nr:asparagine synthase-related protein [Roseofilum reptotaenium]MDB9518577.1 asparagine synthase-related protein [Roseofilum reptotaenium CS-1145]OJJ27025.1 asparagine synthetase B [Roseofilum reptotaenium AO1-A]